MDIPQSEPPRRSRTDLISAGVLIAVVGVLLLVDRVSDRDVPLVTAWWPLLLIALGVVRLDDPEPSRRRQRRPGARPGAWLVMVGLWGLVNEAHLFGFHYGNSWPLLVVATGAMMVWRSVDGGCGPALRREQ